MTPSKEKAEEVARDPEANAVVMMLGQDTSKLLMHIHDGKNLDLGTIGKNKQRLYMTLERKGLVFPDRISVAELTPLGRRVASILKEA